MPNSVYDPSLELVRITTAGNVDDGKSTLTGRLLYDLKQIHSDQLAAIANHRPLATGTIDFSLLTDGLIAEREQKITIDVAYRYFSTAHRRFIIADVPGHVQYLRNMVTGASTADILVIVADVQRHLQPQTKKHLLVARLFSIPHVVIALNKMDLVGYEKRAFRKYSEEISEYSDKLGLKRTICVPISAIWGEGIVHRPKSMPWYHGPTLLKYLEKVRVNRYPARQPLRFPIQVVLPPIGKFSRRYAGRLLSGTMRVGQSVRLLPTGLMPTIKGIYLGSKLIQEAISPQSVSVTLTGEHDLSRGSSIVDVSHPPRVSSELEAELLWLGKQPLRTGDTYLIKHTTNQIQCSVQYLGKSQYQAEARGAALKIVEPSELARVRLTTTSPLVIDDFRTLRYTGIFILIDRVSADTVAVGMIIGIPSFA